MTNLYLSINNMGKMKIVLICSDIAFWPYLFRHSYSAFVCCIKCQINSLSVDINSHAITSNTGDNFSKPLYFTF